MTDRSGYLVAMCDTSPDSQMFVRPFLRLYGKDHVDMMVTDLTAHLSTEEMSFSDRLRMLFSLAFTGKCTVSMEYSVLLSRDAAIQANDQLIEALYYDENGVHVG